MTRPHLYPDHGRGPVRPATGPDRDLVSDCADLAAGVLAGDADPEDRPNARRRAARVSIPWWDGGEGEEG